MDITPFVTQTFGCIEPKAVKKIVYPLWINTHPDNVREVTGEYFLPDLFSRSLICSDKSLENKGICFFL